MRDRALSGGAIGAGAGALGGALIGIPAAGAVIGAAAGVGVGVATTPEQAQASAPRGTLNNLQNSDHVVITYLTGGREPKDARAENVRFASRSCGGGAVLISEQIGTDARGSWIKLVYGCLAKDIARRARTMR